MERAIPFFQTLGFYEQLAANITGGSASYYCTIIGVVPTVSIFAVLAAGKLINKSERLSLLIGVALCLAGICIAYVGSVMNGFGYSTDRWQDYLGVLRRLCRGPSLPALRHFALRNWVRLDIGLALLLAFLLLTPTKKLQFWVVFAIIAVILAGAVTVTFLRGRQQHANNTKRPSRGCRPFRHALPSPSPSCSSAPLPHPTTFFSLVMGMGPSAPSCGPELFTITPTQCRLKTI